MRVKTKINESKKKSAKTVLEGVEITPDTINEIDVKKWDTIQNRICNVLGVVCIAIMAYLTMGSVCFATADPAKDAILSVVSVVCKVFRYIGIVLGIFSVGQLLLSFKTEDMDSKARATNALVVSCCLIGIDAIIEFIDLQKYL